MSKVFYVVVPLALIGLVIFLNRSPDADADYHRAVVVILHDHTAELNERAGALNDALLGHGEGSKGRIVEEITNMPGEAIDELEKIDRPPSDAAERLHAVAVEYLELDDAFLERLVGLSEDDGLDPRGRQQAVKEAVGDYKAKKDVLVARIKKIEREIVDD